MYFYHDCLIKKNSKERVNHQFASFHCQASLKLEAAFAPPASLLTSVLNSFAVQELMRGEMNECQ